MRHYILTPDLILRDWSIEDIPEFARLNSDEKVMEYFLAKLSYPEALDLYNRIQDEFKATGYGMYAVQERTTGSFIGCVGLHKVTFDIDFAPAIEIAWRLLPEFWGKGYATQAALGCLDYAKNELGLDEIYSFTSLPNTRSERVMQRIGMERVGEFNHPLVDLKDPLCRHILYKIRL